MNWWPRLRLLVLLCLVGGLATESSIQATTVRQFDLADLVRKSHVVVRAQILGVKPEPALVRYSIRPVDVLFGELAEGYELEILRGIMGLPVFEVGKEYLLFINFDNTVERVLAGEWATYRIEDGAVFDYELRPVTLTGLRLEPVAVDPGQPRQPTSPPEQVTFEELRQVIVQTTDALREQGTLLLFD